MAKAQAEEKVSRRSTQSKRFGIDTTRGGTVPACPPAGHTGSYGRFTGARCFSFDFLVKKLKFYGLFFARLLSNKSGISIRCQRLLRSRESSAGQGSRATDRQCDDPDNLLAWTFVRPSSPADIDKLFTALRGNCWESTKLEPNFGLLKSNKWLQLPAESVARF